MKYQRMWTVVLCLGISGCGAEEQLPGDGSVRDATSADVRDSAMDVTTARDATSDVVDNNDGMSMDVPVADRVVPSRDVSVVMTADNAYGFGYGDGAQMMNYFGGIENTSAGGIFSCPVGNGPEAYTVPAASAPLGAYLYIITWSDRSTTQGVIGQFQRGNGTKIYTGDSRFEVCATGVEYSLGSRGPTMDVINREITNCNNRAGTAATTSLGWVTSTPTAAGALAIGEDNRTDRTAVTPGNEFPIACGIDPDAHWMWFNWSPSTVQWPTNGSPFVFPSGASGNVLKQFLIFRIAAEYIPG